MLSFWVVLHSKKYIGFAIKNLNIQEFIHIVFGKFDIQKEHKVCDNVGNVEEILIQGVF